MLYYRGNFLLCEKFPLSLCPILNIVMEKSTDRAELRERIIDAATQLFQAQGVKQVRMDDVARELSISKKTLYETFADKEELLLEVVKVTSSSLCEDIWAILESSVSVLEQIFMLYSQVIKHCRGVNPLFFVELIRYPKVEALFEREHARHSIHTKAWLQKGVEEGLLRDDVNYEVFLRQGGFQIDKLLTNPEVRKYPAEVIYKSVVLVMLRGLATKKGLEIIEQWKI